MSTGRHWREWHRERKNYRYRDNCPSPPTESLASGSPAWRPMPHTESGGLALAKPNIISAQKFLFQGQVMCELDERARMDAVFPDIVPSNGLESIHASTDAFSRAWVC